MQEKAIPTIRSCSVCISNERPTVRVRARVRARIMVRVRARVTVRCLHLQ